MRTPFRAWFGDNKGTTAVEFSLVALPFVMLIVGTIEMALMFTAQSVLQESTFTAARMIRTGQLQQGDEGDAQELFREEVCNFAALLIPCGQIQFSVRTVPSFSDAEDFEPEYDEDGNLVEEFDPGSANDVVLIRVSYNYPVRTPMMQPVLSNNDLGTRTMLSTIVLRTEPYE